MLRNYRLLVPFVFMYCGILVAEPLSPLLPREIREFNEWHESFQDQISKIKVIESLPKKRIFDCEKCFEEYVASCEKSERNLDEKPFLIDGSADNVCIPEYDMMLRPKDHVFWQYIKDAPTGEDEPHLWKERIRFYGLLINLMSEFRFQLQQDDPSDMPYEPPMTLWDFGGNTELNFMKYVPNAKTNLVDIEEHRKCILKSKSYKAEYNLTYTFLRVHYYQSIKTWGKETLHRVRTFFPEKSSDLYGLWLQIRRDLQYFKIDAESKLISAIKRGGLLLEKYPDKYEGIQETIANAKQDLTLLREFFSSKLKTVDAILPKLEEARGRLSVRCWKEHG